MSIHETKVKIPFGSDIETITDRIQWYMNYWQENCKFDNLTNNVDIFMDVILTYPNLQLVADKIAERIG